MFNEERDHLDKGSRECDGAEPDREEAEHALDLLDLSHCAELPWVVLLGVLVVLVCGGDFVF